MNKLKVCVVTGTRAEYGLLKNIIKRISLSTCLHLQVVVTGSHLSNEYGNTVQEIKEDGVNIDHEIEILLSTDTGSGVTKSMGVAMIGFADVLKQIRPNIVLIVGDRYEAFCAAAASLIAQIPIAHCHGGEITEGAYDDSLRHCITKMSHLHFVSSEDYARRVIQLGEQPDRVFNVGGLGPDAISYINLLNRTDLQSQIGFSLRSKNLLVTYHPITASQAQNSSEFDELLLALESRKDYGIIFTMPNSDNGHSPILESIRRFCRENSNAKFFSSLGQLRYLSCLQFVDAVLGNSSSGLLEAPTLNCPTINIGTRQKGRLKADSVIDVNGDSDEISAAIDKIHSSQFRNIVLNASNPCFKPGASEAVVKILESIDVQLLSPKKFYDLTFDW